MTRLGRFLFGTPDATFEVEVPPEMLEAMTYGGRIAPKISRAEALQVPAVLRSRNLICATLAVLPMHLRNKDREIVTGARAPTTLLDQIDQDIPNVVTLADTYEDLLFKGEAWWHVTDRNAQGYPTFCEHIDPTRVFVSDAERRVYVDGFPVPDQDVIRFYSPNPPLLTHAARAIRTCLTLDQTAANYGDNPLPLGYFTPKDGARPNEQKEAVEQLLNTWEEARRRRVYGYVGAAWDLKALQFNAEQIQLAEQRQHAVLEIARAAGVDPEDLGVSTTTRTYQNAEQRRQDLVDFTLSPYRGAVEQRLSMGDVTPRGYEVKVNMDGFLRGDTLGRMQAYEIARRIEALTHDEMRELEDRPDTPEPAAVVANARSVVDDAAVSRRLEVVE
jgi:hypothetical protein